MLMTRTEKLMFLSSLFTDKERFLDPAARAECCMFLECDLYEPEDLRFELCKIFHVHSPYPVRKHLTEYVQLSLF